METEYNQDHQQRDGAMAFVECPAVVTVEGIGEGEIAQYSCLAYQRASSSLA